MLFSGPQPSEFARRKIRTRNRAKGDLAVLAIFRLAAYDAQFEQQGCVIQMSESSANKSVKLLMNLVVLASKPCVSDYWRLL